jgi:hypothetical protein
VDGFGIFASHVRPPLGLICVGRPPPKQAASNCNDFGFPPRAHSPRASPNIPR